MKRFLFTLLIIFCLFASANAQYLVNPFKTNAHDSLVGGGAIALIASAKKGAINNATATTDAIDTTGANFLLVALGDYGVSPLPPITDNKSNTFTPLTSYLLSANARVTLFYCANPTVGSGHTFSEADGGSNYPGIIAAAFSNVATSSPFDTENGANSNTGTTLATGSASPAQNNSLLVSAVASDQASATPDSGFTLIETQAWSGTNFGIVLAYKAQTAAGAENVTWTLGGNRAATIAVFKPL